MQAAAVDMAIGGEENAGGEELEEQADGGDKVNGEETSLDEDGDVGAVAYKQDTI